MVNSPMELEIVVLCLGVSPISSHIWKYVFVISLTVIVGRLQFASFNIANNTNFLCNGIAGARVKNRFIFTSSNVQSIYSGSTCEKPCSSAYIAESPQ
jgi:hypothetical protein